MKNKKYTKRNLIKVKKQYEKNFKKLLKVHPNTLKHIELVEKEKKLHKLEIKILKVLNKFIPDPCPLTKMVVTCNECTGYYKPVPLKTKITKENTYENVMVKKDKGIKCPLKRPNYGIDEYLAQIKGITIW